MKKIILAFAVSFPLIAMTQITVVDKPTVIIKLKNGQWETRIEREIVKEDTLYQFIFRNHSYSELIDFKLIDLTKPQLKELENAFETSVTGKVGDDVTTPRYIISKSKDFGFTLYTLYYQRATCELSPKQVGKLIEAIKIVQ